MTVNEMFKLAMANGYDPCDMCKSGIECDYYGKSEYSRCELRTMGSSTGVTPVLFPKQLDVPALCEIVETINQITQTHKSTQEPQHKSTQESQHQINNAQAQTVDTSSQRPDSQINKADAQTVDTSTSKIQFDWLDISGLRFIWHHLSQATLFIRVDLSRKGPAMYNTLMRVGNLYAGDQANIILFALESIYSEETPKVSYIGWEKVTRSVVRYTELDFKESISEAYIFDAASHIVEYYSHAHELNKEDLIVRTAHMAIEVYTKLLKDKHSKAKIFVNLSGHVNAISIRIYPNGWSSEAPYISADSQFENIDYLQDEHMCRFTEMMSILAFMNSLFFDSSKLLPFTGGDINAL